jgi:hypothetical protein
MKKYIVMSALALGLCMSSCDSYLDINQNPQSPSEANVTSSMIMPGAEMAIANAYGNYLRITGGYHSQVYAQLNGTSNYVDYSEFQQSATRCSGTYTQLYQSALVNLKTILEKSEASGEWGTYLAATTLRAFAFETLVDCFGETPYTEALDADNLSPKYDDGKTVYDGLIAEIDNALSKASASNTVCTNFLFPDASAEQWIQFAKALKLKLLMREANVDSSVLPKVKALIDENDFPTKDIAYTSCWGTESGSMNPFYSEEFSSAWGSTQENVCANLAITPTTNKAIEKCHRTIFGKLHITFHIVIAAICSFLRIPTTQQIAYMISTIAIVDNDNLEIISKCLITAIVTITVGSICIEDTLLSIRRIGNDDGSGNRSTESICIGSRIGQCINTRLGGIHRSCYLQLRRNILAIQITSTSRVCKGSTLISVHGCITLQSEHWIICDACYTCRTIIIATGEGNCRCQQQKHDIKYILFHCYIHFIYETLLDYSPQNTGLV